MNAPSDDYVDDLPETIEVQGFRCERARNGLSSCMWTTGPRVGFFSDTQFFVHYYAAPEGGTWCVSKAIHGPTEEDEQYGLFLSGIHTDLETAIARLAESQVALVQRLTGAK